MATLLFASCKDDDDFQNVTVSNSELLSILKEKGYTFTSEGQLVQDDMVQNTTSLDLSGTKISDFSGFDVLPNLTELNLSDNGYGLSFDFSELPSNITGVDLTGNEIYEYTGLVKVTVDDNDEETVTVLRDMTKLDLPATAKYDTQQLPVFYAQKESEISAGTVEMKMGDEDYNVLRDIPDDGLRGVLKGLFPSLFSGDQVNLANEIRDALEEARSVGILPYTVDTAGIKSFEGVQYIFEHRAYKGNTIYFEAPDTTTIPFFKVYNEELTTIHIVNINTPNGIDFGDDATSLCTFYMVNNPEVTSLDLSASEKMGQRDADQEYALYDCSWLHIECCSKLEELNLLPADASIIYRINLYNLPNLKKLELSQLDALKQLHLGVLGECSISYISPTKWFVKETQDVDDYDNAYSYMRFGITEDVYNKAETKDFLSTYHSHLKKTGVSSFYGSITSFSWQQYYDQWSRPSN